VNKVALTVSERLWVTSCNKYPLLLGIYSTNCREENKVASKLGALLVLRGLLDLEINPESIPEQVVPETRFDTIVEAGYVRPVDGVNVER